MVQQLRACADGHRNRLRCDLLLSLEGGYVSEQQPAAISNFAARLSRTLLLPSFCSLLDSFHTAHDDLTRCSFVARGRSAAWRLSGACPHSSRSALLLLVSAQLVCLLTASSSCVVARPAVLGILWRLFFVCARRRRRHSLTHAAAT